MSGDVSAVLTVIPRGETDTGRKSPATKTDTGRKSRAGADPSLRRGNHVWLGRHEPPHRGGGGGAETTTGGSYIIHSRWQQTDLLESSPAAHSMEYSDSLRPNS